ncbi:asparaginase [Marinilactibacillus sp. XAAS-LB27]|uniref:asparaginase n=1 Tax=Marinilactibacillus sp. XAAS-LB27 TaxID=3114538 RepID=UPI002E19F309|nr:asparaginase [Marinilactibacillus sp. XAAS-LB27]
MKHILILHTGGTISMSTDQSTGVVKPSSEHPLNEYKYVFDQEVRLTEEDILQLPSPHMTPADMLIVKNRILEAIRTNDNDGVVITHGTDTLEETAYFLDLTVPFSIPIVMTGAMRPTNEIGSDGVRNLQNAVWTAMSDDAADKGVLVVMNEEIHAARYVTKTHTTNVATFRTPTFGPIGIVSKKEVMFFQKLIKKECFPINSVNKVVPLLKAYAGMDGFLIESLVESSIDGLVIEALGAGNMPPATLKGLHALIEKGVPIVLTSRAFNGIAQDIYDYEGGGKQLKNAGVIFAPGLSGPKARLKLLVVLEQSTDLDYITEVFEKV